MTTAQVIWAVSGLTAFLLLPVGAFRMVAYRSGEVDHTPQLRLVARLALGIGGVALMVFAATTIWFLATGERPV
ncbi:MAG: hypothetical protein ACOYX5_12595 [Actinomycetota bacterium]